MLACGTIIQGLLIAALTNRRTFPNVWANANCGAQLGSVVNYRRCG